MLKEILAANISETPDVLQFAKDRKYEEAWIIREDALPTATEIQKYLDTDKFDVLIAEYVWHSSDDARRFVLTFFLDPSCKLGKNPAEFAKLCVEILRRKCSFSELVEELDKHAVGKPYLFRRKPEIAVLGIFNNWLSTGPIELWTAENPADCKAVEEKLLARPEITRTRLNYQGLAFLFNFSGRSKGPRYGIKTPCCKKEGNEWVADPKTICNWMRQLQAPEKCPVKILINPCKLMSR